MRMMKTSTFLGALLFAVACGGGADMVAYTPVKQKTKFREEQLFGAAERAIDKLGYMPINKSLEGYTVETREKEVGYSSVPRLFYRYSFQIDTKGGVLAIRSTCKQNSPTAREEYEDCGDERPRRVVEEQQNLGDTIMEIAATLP